MMNPGGASQCDVFVTHAWCEPFADLVETLQQGAVDPEERLFLCCFSIDQNDPAVTASRACLRGLLRRWRRRQEAGRPLPTPHALHRSS